MDSNKKGTIEKVIANILLEKKEALTGESLAELSGLKLARVRAALGNMVKNRILKRAGGGKFIISARYKEDEKK